jgi:hypothetical protein
VLAARSPAAPPVALPNDLRVLSDAGQHLAAARALSRAGLHSAANDELKAALEQDPTIRVPDKLASPTGREPRWQGYLGKFGPWLLTVAAPAAPYCSSAR